MKVMEHFLIRLDSWPWSAIWRITLGFCIPPVLRMLPGGGDAVWTTLVLFIGLLALLRIVPALLRRALPFSAEAKELWAERRDVAKRYDSYQWQKLFWIGIGLLSYVVFGGGLRNGEAVLAFICLFGGSAALWFWRRVDAVRSAS